MLRKSLSRLGGASLILGIVVLFAGCSAAQFTTMDPVGPIGTTERDITIFTIILMMFVLIPIVALTLGIAWKYRASNTESTYDPRWSHSMLIEFFAWGGPIVILIILAVVTWTSTHDIDPYKAIKSDKKPIQIEAVAMDWKWLFIYPQEHVASLNEFAFPKDVPLQIHLTSNSVMTAFMIQRMGTQIFAMSGMQTQLHLLSHETGNFEGGNYQYSGPGFAKMRFVAKGMTEQNYQQWLAHVRQAGTPMNLGKFQQLAKPSDANGVAYYAPVAPHLFHDVIGQFHNGNGPAKAPGMKPEEPAAQASR